MFPSESFRPYSNIFAPLILMATFAMAAYTDYNNVKRGVASSSSLFWLWFTLAISTTFTFTSFVRFPYDHPAGERALFFLYYGLVVAQLFLSSWAGHATTHVQFQGTVLALAECR